MKNSIYINELKMRYINRQINKILIKILRTSVIALFIIPLNISANNRFTNFKSEYINFAVTPIEESLFKEYGNKNFQTMKMSRAAFIASGLSSEAELNRYEKKYEHFINGLKKKHPNLMKMKELKRAQTILLYIHENLFKEYKFWNTTFKHIFDFGGYNCLISAVFFNTLCQDFGLKTRGTTSSIHAISLVYAGSKTYVVEATTKRKFIELKEKYKSPYCNVEMVAAVWGNLSAYHTRQGDPIKGIRYGYRSIKLAPDNKHTIINFSASYNAFANTFFNKHEYLKAMSILEEIMVYFPENKEFQNNYKNYAIVHINTFVDNRKFTEAREFNKQMLANYPDSEILKNNRKKILINQARYLYSISDFEGSIKVYEEANQEFPKDAIILNNYKVSLSNAIIIHFKNQEYLKAKEITQKAISIYPNDPQFKKLLDYCNKMTY